jgi:hypothetical protein
MSKRIRNHLRTNVVGYVALFFVLTGGTAYALDGSNTVFSDDIVNGEVKTADLGADSVQSGKILNGQVKVGDLGTGAVNSDKVLDNTLGAADLATGSVTGDELAGTGFGNNGFNADEEIIDGTVTTFDIGFQQVSGFNVADNSLTESDISDSYGSAGSGLDLSCFDDDGDGEVCANTTFSLGDPGSVLLNATGEWRTFTNNPVEMVCQLQVDGVNVGLPQAFGEEGSNHSSPFDGTMALTALTGTLAAGSHTFRNFCTQTDADIDLESNQITAARVDG